MSAHELRVLAASRVPAVGAALAMVLGACIESEPRPMVDVGVDDSTTAELVEGEVGDDTVVEVDDAHDIVPTDVPDTEVEPVDVADTGDADVRNDLDAPDGPDLSDGDDTGVAAEVIDAVEDVLAEETRDTVPSGDPLTPADTAPADTADSGGADGEVVGPEDVEVVETAECGLSSDCAGKPVAPQCQAWTCRSGSCVLEAATEGVSCDDGDLCTLGDTCRSGVCQLGAGRPLCPDDPSSFGCRVGACDPLAGCGFVASPAGTPCQNGTGTLPGSCVEGGFLASDTCDGRGACVDAQPPDALTSQAPRLDGTWLMAYWTFGRYTTPMTGRAALTLEAPTRKLAITSLHEHGTVPFDIGDEGYLCTKDRGVLEVRLGARRLIGHQLDEELAVVTDTSNDAIAVLARADTTRASDVHGTYSYLQTTIVFGTTSPTTWRGDLTFVQGCLVSGSFTADPAVSGPMDFTPSATGDCLVAADELGDRGLFELTTSVRAQSGGQTYPIYYRGAVTMGGDVMVLIKEKDAGSPTPEYGVTLLVRDTGASFTPSELAGNWRYNLHAKLDTASPRRDVGSVTWDTAGTITGGALGTLEGTVLSPSGWSSVNVDDNGLSHKVALPGLDIYQSGVIDPSARFVVGWVVPAPLDGSSPAALSDVPRGGSVLLMLRPD